ncbi:MAG TPA: zinc ribbon domain-containing protein [Gemmatimonadales bacterium]|nr:zinc ribbon domain-containing protein [Gemmatimonadales bacterium]
MTDLERLFRRLVDNLIAIDPARLHRPLTIGDLLGSIIPYRTTRRALSIDSAEDYDVLVMRLCAGEAGFVRMLSDDVAQVLRDQISSPNPDLDVLREHKQAELVLQTEPLAHALGPGPEEAFAPPEVEEFFEEPEPEPPSRRAPSLRSEQAAEPPSRRISFAAEPAPPMVPPPPRITAEPTKRTPSPPSAGLHAEGSTRCSFCGGRLPSGRTINFCPHCGQNQSMNRCPECQSDLEIGWKHCINCGHPTGEA